MRDFLKKDPFVVYQFWVDTKASSVDVAKKNLEQILLDFANFADSLGISHRADATGPIDGTVEVRLQFYIHAPQDVILMKVSALFAFAATHKLYFANQFFET